MELAKATVKRSGTDVYLIPDRSNEDLFELTKQLGDDIRANPYTGESTTLTSTLIALHDCIWTFIIRFGDDAKEVFELKQIFRGLNPDAYMKLLD